MLDKSQKLTKCKIPIPPYDQDLNQVKNNLFSDSSQNKQQKVSWGASYILGTNTNSSGRKTLHTNNGTNLFPAVQNEIGLDLLKLYRKGQKHQQNYASS